MRLALIRQFNFAFQVGAWKCLHGVFSLLYNDTADFQLTALSKVELAGRLAFKETCRRRRAEFSEVCLTRDLVNHGDCAGMGFG